MEFFGSDSDEEGLDNHAIDQLLAACMRLVPPLAGLRPALRLGDSSRCFADRAAAAGFDVVTGACDVLLVDDVEAGSGEAGQCRIVAIQRVIAIQWCTTNSSARMSLLHSATTASSVHHRRLACSALMMPRERARVQMRAVQAYTVVQVQTHDHAVRPARVTLPLADIDDNIPSVGPQRIGRQIQPLNMCTHT